MARPRKPLTLAICEGDPGHKGRRNLRTDKRPKSTATFPGNAGKELGPRARAIFDEVCEELSEMRVLSAPDWMITTVMANALSDAQEARAEAERLRAEGKRTRDVLQQISRAEKREDRKLGLFVKCSDRLGLSPRSRENLTIAPHEGGMGNLMKLLMKPRPARTVDPDPSEASRCIDGENQ